MTRSFAAKVIHYLLAISLLMLVFGSAFHVHDYHAGSADTCLWCLAAITVAVLVVSFALTGILLVGRRFTPLPLLTFVDHRPWSPRASRAPPVQ